MGALLVLRIALFSILVAHLSLGNRDGLSSILENGGFSMSCVDTSLTSQGLLVSNCKDAEGGQRATGLDLNQVIGNSNGYLEAGGYAFTESCSDIHLDGATLVARCADRDGAMVDTSLDLDVCVDNSDGQLTWDC